MNQNSDHLHKGHRNRMRKRFLQNGFDGFSDHEILEFLLFFSIPRCDTNELAHSIIDEYKTLANVFEADPTSLAKFPGIGENSATLLTMIPHLARVYEQSKCKRNETLYDTNAIGRYAITVLKGKVNEELALICVDANRKVHWSGIIAKGTLDRIGIPPRLVISEVVKRNAKYIILAHNHLGGSLAPSPSDKETTRNLADALRPFDVKIIDHVIVCDNRYYSMAESGFTF